jgi:hypothetical protein
MVLRINGNANSITVIQPVKAQHADRAIVNFSDQQQT